MKIDADITGDGPAIHLHIESDLPGVDAADIIDRSINARKPVRDNRTYLCHSCGRHVERDGIPWNFCPKCGQRIKWEDNSNESY